MGLILFLIVFLFYLPILIFNDKNTKRKIFINSIFLLNLSIYLIASFYLADESLKSELEIFNSEYSTYLFPIIIMSLIFNLSLYLTRFCFFIEKIPIKVFQIVVCVLLLCFNIYFVDYSYSKYSYAKNTTIQLDKLFYISISINFFIITAILGLIKTLQNNYVILTWNTFGFVLSIIFYFYVSPDEQNFDSDLWLKDENKRYSMLNNLIEKEKLIGKSKNEVVSLLDTTACKQFKYSDDNWGYIISKPGFTFITDVPTTWLTVSFKGGKVIKVNKDD